ncbi:MAG: short-chain fatty acyl-CoA regulator family protein [Paracoccaceae bacterium]
MPRVSLAGTRIRERRLALGLRQADVARRVDISSSYLNLIEHNRRPVGARLLAQLAGILGVPTAALTEGAEQALVTGLRDAASRPQEAPLLGILPETDQIDEFLGRFPGWSGLIVGQQRLLTRMEMAIEALNDRMAHDTHLSAALHEVLSAATAVRSTATILAETPDLEPEWRDTFHTNIAADSLRLTRGAEALVGYLDTAVAGEGDGGLAAPQEELEAWLAATGYHVAAMERPSPPEPEELVADAAELATVAARRMAVDYLKQLRADVQAMPLDRISQALSLYGPDPSALARDFGCDLVQVFRRLASLTDEHLGTRLGLVRCDGSGTLTFRRPVEGFPLPRFGGACPLWPLYQALARPMQPIRARLEMPGRPGARFIAMAICQPRTAAGFDMPEVWDAAMLILPDTGRDLPSDTAPRPVGTACRICPRRGCPARREPSIVNEEP